MRWTHLTRDEHQWVFLPLAVLRRTSTCGVPRLSAMGNIGCWSISQDAEAHEHHSRHRKVVEENGLEIRCGDSKMLGMFIGDMQQGLSSPPPIEYIAHCTES